ncbi:MAG: hypothetical protein NUV73_01505 [Candidatus Daviesbacteria bacterium]|nr:hypothetical protein [Candidatus Daviesbacteria bacterium]
MAIEQTKKQSDLEKRLQLLRRQVYGKNQKEVIEPKNSSTRLVYRHTDTPTHRNTDILTSSDLIYLHQDLLKIVTFASFAIGTQILLFFILKNNILKINLF